MLCCVILCHAFVICYIMCYRIIPSILFCRIAAVFPWGDLSCSTRGLSRVVYDDAVEEDEDVPAYNAMMYLENVLPRRAAERSALENERKRARVRSTPAYASI